MSRHEKPQAKNPHRLTVKQHVFPLASMQRFVDADGLVMVRDNIKSETRNMNPDNAFFCAMRSWDQRAESGYMKDIEDVYQDLASRIHAGQISELQSNDYLAISNFYALWFARSRARTLDAQETPLKSVTGENRTKDEEEHLEKMGVHFVRGNGTVPSRFINGVQIQTHIDMVTDRLNATSWGIVRAVDGEFLIPDIPSEKHIPIVPVNPTTILVAATPSGEIERQNLIEINSALLSSSEAYYFGHDLRKAICQ